MSLKNVRRSGLTEPCTFVLVVAEVIIHCYRELNTLIKKNRVIKKIIKTVFPKEVEKITSEAEVKLILDFRIN